MFGRRTFLAGVGAALTLPLVRKFEWFIEQHQQPFLEAPPHVASTLYVGYCGLDGWDDAITLGLPTEAPPISWREYFQKYHDDVPLSHSDLLDACFDFGMDPCDLDRKCDWYGWDELWHTKYGPLGGAFELLSSLDIGPILQGAAGEIGQISFKEYSSMCSYSRVVEVYDDLSISLLQHRLTQLGTHIEVKT